MQCNVFAYVQKRWFLYRLCLIVVSGAWAHTHAGLSVDLEPQALIVVGEAWSLAAAAL